MIDFVRNTDDATCGCFCGPPAEVVVFITEALCEVDCDYNSGLPVPVWVSCHNAKWADPIPEIMRFLGYSGFGPCHFSWPAEDYWHRNLVLASKSSWRLQAKPVRRPLRLSSSYG